MTNAKILSWALAAAALAFAIVPFFTPFDGFEPDAFPIPQDNPPAQPAGYAFAIWGLIYLWLIVSTVFGAVRRADDADWQKARTWLIASLVIGIFWLPVAGRSPVLALIMIWAMLATAVAALARTPRDDHLLFRAPVGLYAGWLMAASWVSVALNGAGFGLFFGETGWAVVAILGALVMSLTLVSAQTSVPTFAAGVIWALIAVTVKDWPLGYTLIAGLAAVGAALLAVVAVLRWRRDRTAEAL